MGEFPVASRKNDFQTAPRAFTASGQQGQVAVLAVSTTAIAVDLTKGISQAPKSGLVSGQNPVTPTRNYISIESDVDIGIVFGQGVSAVSGANAPNLSAVGALSGNTYTGSAGTCWLVKAITSGQAAPRFMLQEGFDTAIGIVATGAGKVRLYQSSPDDA